MSSSQDLLLTGARYPVGLTGVTKKTEGRGFNPTGKAVFPSHPRPLSPDWGRGLAGEAVLPVGRVRGQLSAGLKPRPSETS